MHGFKVIAIAKLLQDCKSFVGPDRPIMMLDGSDVAIQGTEQDILRAFKRINYSIVFGTGH